VCPSTPMDAMPLDTTTTLAPDRVEASARALADTLDSLLGYDDDQIADALLSIGELLGGLGCRGFRADLDAHLERLEEDRSLDAQPAGLLAGLGRERPRTRCSAPSCRTALPRPARRTLRTGTPRQTLSSSAP
jgi:hypothetical protein